MKNCSDPCFNVDNLSEEQIVNSGITKKEY